MDKLEKDRLKEIQRKEYYLKNKEKMNRIARERYHSKKDDPTFYQNCLEKNKEAYCKKTGRIERTPEEEEEYFQMIRRHVASTRDPRDKDFFTTYNYQQIHDMFFSP